jgi:hypothetical protein
MVGKKVLDDTAGFVLCRSDFVFMQSALCFDGLERHDIFGRRPHGLRYIRGNLVVFRNHRDGLAVPPTYRLDCG